VMTFTWEFALRSPTEWSVVIARSGSMAEAELTAWEKCLHREVISQDVPLHVTLACVEEDTPLTLLPSPLDSKFTMTLFNSVVSKTSFHDLTSTAHILVPYHRTSLLARNAHFTGPNNLAVDSESDSQHIPYAATPRPSQFGLSPLASAYILHTLPSSDHSVATGSGSEEFTASMSSVQVHIMRTGGSPTSSLRKPLRVLLQDITKNYCGLAVLARERWAISSFGMIPFHLAAVEIMRRVVTYTKD